MSSFRQNFLLIVLVAILAARGQVCAMGRASKQSKLPGTAKAAAQGTTSIRGLGKKSTTLFDSDEPEPAGILAEVEREDAAERRALIRPGRPRRGAPTPAAPVDGEQPAGEVAAGAGGGAPKLSGIRKLRRKEQMQGSHDLQEVDAPAGPADGISATETLLQRENEMLRAEMGAASAGAGHEGAQDQFGRGWDAPGGHTPDEFDIQARGEARGDDHVVPDGFRVPLGLRAVLPDPNAPPASPPLPFVRIPGVTGAMEAHMAFSVGFEAVLVGAAASRARAGVDADLSLGDLRTLLGDLVAAGHCPLSAVLAEGVSATAGAAGAIAAVRSLEALGVGGAVVSDGPGGLWAGTRVLPAQEFLQGTRELSLLDSLPDPTRVVGAAAAARRSAGALLLLARSFLPRVAGGCQGSAGMSAAEETRQRLKAALSSGADGLILDWWPPESGARDPGVDELQRMEELCLGLQPCPLLLVCIHSPAAVAACGGLGAVSEALQRAGCAGVLLPEAAPRAAEGAAWGALRSAFGEQSTQEGSGTHGRGGQWGSGGERSRAFDELAGADAAALALEMG